MSRRLARLGIGRVAFVLGVLVVLTAAIAVATTSGPDVTVITVSGSSNYGLSGDSLYRGYSIGATSCNVGSQPVWWCDNTTGYCNNTQHPVIAQNLYRLDTTGHFEQIGMSWLKHGFLSTNSTNSACNPLHPTCTTPPHFDDQLGLGCTDTYGSSLNGSTPLGKRSEVNATTGVYPYPYTQVGTSDGSEQHARVLQSDVDPAQNAGALYWGEVQYVTADDAAANNGLNNASYRPLTVNASTFNLTFSDTTVREKTAIYAWQAADPAVEVINTDVVSGSLIIERFEVARKVTDTSGVGSGPWHFEYAIRNVNSDRSARSFSVVFPVGTTFSNAGDHVINHHSGEPYATFDWDLGTSADTITWSTDDFATDANANALRWGTLFSFWFDADHPLAGTAEDLGLFTPGEPSSVRVPLYANGFEGGSFGNWSAHS